MKKLLVGLVALLLVLLAGPLLVVATGQASLAGDWSSADRRSARIAPEPAQHAAAIVQVYAARAFSWRGIFGVHTWIAMKEADADHYEVVEVLGWRARGGGLAVRSSRRAPDMRWFGAEPKVLFDRRGEAAARLVEPIRAAARDYPWSHRYGVWPGPNSNTFVAHVIRQVPGLDLELPVTAIGKDYLGKRWFARATSDTGYQFSLAGLLGVTLSLDEGLELNLLGLSFGVDLLRPALKLPGIGRIGMA